MLDKDNKKRFFEGNVLLTDVKPDIVIGISFLTMSNSDIDFQARDLQWRYYTTRDILLITRKVELIGKKKFVISALDPEYKTFVVHVAAFSIDSGDKVHFLK